MLKIYVINQVQSSRRWERETARNVEMTWLTGRLAPDFKTIADFRKDNGPAIRLSWFASMSSSHLILLAFPRSSAHAHQPILRLILKTQFLFSPQASGFA
jgi:hypothetical protein